jgi:hypothetical protein
MILLCTFEFQHAGFVNADTQTPAYESSLLQNSIYDIWSSTICIRIQTLINSDLTSLEHIFDSQLMVAF